MGFYLDVTLLPGINIGLPFLWEKIFKKVHLAIVEKLDGEGNSKVGISFPEYSYGKKTLGSKLRFFSREMESLKELAIPKCLRPFMDYVHITSVRPVPRKTLGYSFYKRERTKSSLTRIARRKAKREGITEKLALSRLDGFKERFSKAPYINLQSHETKQRFKLFILKEKTDSLVGHAFSSYGFGIGSSVPEF